jgi:hypothetical protein
MCFGGTTEKTTNSTSSAPDWLTGVAKDNLGFVQGLQNQGFQPYTGQQVADFSPQQTASFGAATNLANSVNGGQIGQMVGNYANAGPQSVQAQSIASQMSPYMNQYVAQSLAPQLQMQDQQFADQNKAVDSSATMAGAFGDTGWGQLRGTTTQAQDAARQGLIGNAYNTAFNTAIGAGAQDVANNLNAQTTNANLAETAIGRQLTGATTLAGLQGQAAGLENQFGGQQTAQQQAQLNALYNQWQLAQQYPFQTAQLMNQTIGAATPGAGTISNSTTSAPDNSGFGILGSLGSSFLGTNAGASALLGGLAFLADGGTAHEGQPTIVGERGPELVIPDTTSVVIPNEVLEAARMLRDQKQKQAAPSVRFGIAA